MTLAQILVFCLLGIGASALFNFLSFIVLVQIKDNTRPEEKPLPPRRLG